MADASISERELSSLYAIYAELDGPVNIKIVPDPIKAGTGPKTSGITKRHRAIWQSNGTWPGLNAVDNFNDVFAFQWQGQAVKEWLKKNSFPTNGWSYGIWDKNITPFSTATGNKAKVTYFMDDVWNLFTEAQKSLFGKKKQDSWNPADIYISQLDKQDESKKLESIKKMQQDTSNLEPSVFVALLNEELRNLYHNGDIIGISLKAAKFPNKPHVKERNIVYDKDFEPPNFGQYKLLKKIDQNMEVGTKGGTLGFKTNSLKFEVDISMSGCDPISYYWESKSPVPNGLPTTEMKDIVGTHDPLKNQLANARTGGIPKDRLAVFIKEYSKDSKAADFKVPKSVVRTANRRTAFANYWAKFITDLKRDANGMIKIDDFIINERDRNKDVETAQSKTLTNSNLYHYWVTTVLEMDAMSNAQIRNAYGYTGKESKFGTNMKNKFRMLRLVRSMVDAEKAGKLGEFLIRAYYSASKMRFSKEELQAPFIKLQ